MAKYSVVAILATLFIGTAQAAVVYDESVNGDLAASSTTNIAFSSGTNSILGSTSYGSEGNDFDGFIFHLGAGQTVTSIIFNAFNQVVKGAPPVSAGFALYSGNYVNLLSQSDVDLLSTADQFLFNVKMPLGEGDYAVSLDRFSSPNGIQNVTSNYELIVEVEGANRVPEPESVALIGLGLAGLALTRRKKHVG